MTTEDMILKSLLASGTPVQEFPDDERRAMQRRIKNQRRELKRLNVQVRGLEMLARNAFNREATARINAYRHAAQIAESIRYWPFGRRIGAYIRKWL